MIKINF